MRIEELTEVYTEEEILDFEELSQEEQDKIFDATLKKIEGANTGKQKRKIIDIFKSFSVAKKIAAAVIIGLVFMGTTALAVEVAQNIRLFVKTENVVNANSLGIRYDVPTSVLYFWSPNMTPEEVEEKITASQKEGIDNSARGENTSIKLADGEALKAYIERRKEIPQAFEGIKEAREYYSVPIVIGDYLEDNYEIYTIRNRMGNCVKIFFCTKDDYEVRIDISEMSLSSEGATWFSRVSRYDEKLVQSDNLKTASGETASVFIGEVKNVVYAYIVDEAFIYEISVSDSDGAKVDFKALLKEIEKVVSSMDLTEDIE